MLQKVVVDKLVHGGQGLGTLENGQKIFIWNALPGETVGVRVGRKKRGFAEGFAEEIITASPERIQPLDAAYLSTSPWQMMTYEAENKYKKDILNESFEREKVSLPKFEFRSVGEPLHYRNKMEYSFWGDDDGLHLALFHRASHGKLIIDGSSIARSEIDKAANKIVAVLNKNGVRASILKSLMLRVNKKGQVVAALFVKDQHFPDMNELNGICLGLDVVFSNPKSPASIITKQLHRYGDIKLVDKLLTKSINYDVHSFFQVNLPVFEDALKSIKNITSDQSKVIDMYAGVGTIGITIGAKTLVETNERNIQMAKQNAPKSTTVLHSSSEEALDLITKDTCVIFDPPRAGLHPKVIVKLVEIKPQMIIYLSCNPSTQARDIAKLSDTYKISEFTGYNFFPRTPHIESLAVLKVN